VADFNLVMQVAMGVTLLIGFILIRRGNWRAHGRNQMVVVVVNLVLIAFVMVNTFFVQVLPDRASFSERRVYLPALHGLLGLSAEPLRIYLVRRMFAPLPRWLKIEPLKPIMRATLALWLFTIAAGGWVYFELYSPSTAATLPGGPAAANEAAVGIALFQDN